MEIENSREFLLVSPCRAEVAHGQAWGYCGVPHPGPPQDPAESSCLLTASELYCIILGNKVGCHLGIMGI